MKKNPKVLLIILDGWGYSENKEHNSIAMAETPYFDYLWQNFPHAILKASGEAVGLPDGQMGNSEVGHTIIGAGKPIPTDLVKIAKTIKEGGLKKIPAILELFDHVKKHNSVLHIKGLLSPGGVHSHSDHFYEFLRLAKEMNIEKIAIHVFTDGRDTPPQSSNQYLKELEEEIGRIGIGFIATASGRFYAMDRDNNWDRLKKVEDAIFDGIGKTSNIRPSETITELHKEGVFDQYIEPIIFLDDKNNGIKVEKNDGILFLNFRKDRARMLTQKILNIRNDRNLCLVTMTQYDKSFDCLVAFPPEKIETTLSEQISRANMNQAHIAETEKFAHVTYYLNGGRQVAYPKEEDILIESRKDIKTHDEAPEMRSREIADATIKQISLNKNFIAVNFANPDMVGHTENTDAIVKAIEYLDIELKRVAEEARRNNYHIIITADHGNAEMNYDVESKQLHTAHTNNPVPIIYIGDKNKKIENGTLSDIAPTVLGLLQINKPKDMTGDNLLA
jgi:2,3-bisphosphoglycerate-independent phosphoglycerate mutase